MKAVVVDHWQEPDKLKVCSSFLITYLSLLSSNLSNPSLLFVSLLSSLFYVICYLPRHFIYKSFSFLYFPSTLSPLSSLLSPLLSVLFPLLSFFPTIVLGFVLPIGRMERGFNRKSAQQQQRLRRAHIRHRSPHVPRLQLPRNCAGKVGVCELWDGGGLCDVGCGGRVWDFLFFFFGFW